MDIKIATIITVFVVISLLLIALLLIWGFPSSGDVKIIDVSYIPENPQPGDNITLIAEVTGGPFLGSGVEYAYYSFFASSQWGAGSMTPIGNNKYSQTIFYPVKDGEEIWYVIKVGDLFSDIHYIQIGHVERSNITSLAIDVVQIPNKPTTATSVEIRANITSNVNITKVLFSHRKWYKKGRSGGSGNMNQVTDGFYVENLNISDDSTVFYRIGAKDELGNTAVTQVFIITLS